MQIQLAIYSLSGNFLADWSTRVKTCNVRSGVHGFESCEADLDVPFYEAFLYYQQLGPLKVQVSWGSYRVWVGRLDDPTQFAQTTSGLKITAFGQWVAFNDIPYIALWSDTTLDSWKILTVEDGGIVQLTPERYEMDNNNRLYIALRTGQPIGAGIDFVMWGYQIPQSSSRQIAGLQCDWEFIAPVGFQWYLQGRSENWPAAGGVNLTTINATGALQTGSFCFAMSDVGQPAQTAINILIYNNSGVAYTVPAGTADGVYYLKITNIRIVTSVANRILTTFTAARAAGTNVTATVASTARMYVGMRLTLSNAAGTVTESVIVLSIGSSTQFNATFVNGYVGGDIVRSLIIYPDEIIKDCVSTVNAVNPTQLSSSVGLIQSQAIDLDQAIYEDVYPTQIINQLLAKSDNQTPPRQWVAMIYNDNELLVRPRGSGRAWYTDVTSLEIVRSLVEMYNSVYAVYKDPAGKRNFRTAISVDSASITKFGLTRRRAVQVDTTDSTQAAKVRDSVLAQHLDPVPRTTIELDHIFDQYGNPYPLFMVRADDTLTIRNLPPILGQTYDKLRTLVITRANCNLVNQTLDIELEIPMPAIDVQLAQLKGSLK